MTPEIEAKFANIDIESMRTKLGAIGAICTQPMRTMIRTSMTNDFMKTGKDGYVRVRDEGNGKVTMTYKQFDAASSDGAKEAEITVSDYALAVEILTQIGASTRDLSIQESRRETWHYGACEVVIDEWPWLNPYIEIEGPNEDALRDVARRLELNWADAQFGDVTVLYIQQYPNYDKTIPLSSLPLARFSDPVPQLLQPTT